MKKLLKSVAALSLSAMMLLSPGVLAEEDEEEEFEEPEPELPEPPLTETLSDYRAQLSGATKACRGAGIFTLLLCVMAVLEHFSILPEAYTADPMIRALPLLAERGSQEYRTR